VTTLATALSLALQLSPATAPERGTPPPRPRGGRAAAPIDAVVAGYPRVQQERYALLVQKCTRCHSMAVSLGTPFTRASWKRHQKRSNAALTDGQAHAIAEFVKFHEGQQASRGAPAADRRTQQQSRR
jgi:hypothetical protein